MAQLDGKQLKFTLDLSLNSKKITNLAAGVAATDAANVGQIAAASAKPTASNKEMTASVTVADFDLACATALVAAPAGASYIEVLVNGAAQILGNGVKTKDCYFSGDGGTTARAFAAIAATDLLYWVGTVAGFQLAITDKIDFLYSV